jgi:hypothetical protein
MRRRHDNLRLPNHAALEVLTFLKSCMSRKRNSWDTVRRQRHVSKKADPTFMIDPRYISYGDEAISESDDAPKTSAYIDLEKRLNEILGISSDELKKRMIESFSINSTQLGKIIAGDLDCRLDEANPWVKHLVQMKLVDSQSRILSALLNDSELCTYRRAEDLKRNREDPNYNLKWSSYGRLDEPKK